MAVKLKKMMKAGMTFYTVILDGKTIGTIKPYDTGRSFHWCARDAADVIIGSARCRTRADAVAKLVKAAAPADDLISAGHKLIADALAYHAKGAA